MRDSSKRFCSADDFFVVIPYKDFEALVNVARNYDSLFQKVQRIEEQLDSLRRMYFEALERIGEISRYL